MMMFLSLLCTGLFAVAVLSAIVYGASPRDQKSPEVRPEAPISLGPSQFFAGDLTAPPSPPAIPLDAVIAQIERHVRLEQAVAESFLEIRAGDARRMPSTRRLVN
jgi:hypothetical protein